MEAFLSHPTRLSLLVVRDVDMDSAARLGEAFVPQGVQFDGIVICGRMVWGDISTPEAQAVAFGDTATTIGFLENIVCRVMYLPSESDPLVMSKEQIFLTANSTSLYGRRLPLTKDLYIAGLTEISNKKATNGVVEDATAMEISSSVTAKILRELLAEANGSHSGMLVLNYHHAHTLNQVLFHMSSELDAAGVQLCIVSNNGPGDELSRMPKRLGNLSIAAPKSLRDGYYSEVVIERDEASERWIVTRNETLQLPAQV